MSSQVNWPDLLYRYSWMHKTVFTYLSLARQNSSFRKQFLQSCCKISLNVNLLILAVQKYLVKFLLSNHTLQPMEALSEGDPPICKTCATQAGSITICFFQVVTEGVYTA